MQAGPGRRHPVAWMLWAAAAATVALLTRNPWYLALLGAAALLVGRRANGARLRGMLSPCLLLSILLFPAALNLLLSRAGATVLLRLPLPWVGGPYTLEAFLFGLSAGVQLAALLAVMVAFGRAVGPADLLRRTPPGLYPVGVAATVALTFAPQVRRSFAEVREAQRVRGFRPRGWRDLPRVITPLVVMSLESALGLAEALAVRGWGRLPLAGWRRWLALAGWTGLASALALWALFPGRPRLSLALALMAALALLPALRAGPLPRYRPERWCLADSLMAGPALLSLAAVVLVALWAPASLTWAPYPQAAWPAFDPRLALALLGLAAPALPGVADG